MHSHALAIDHLQQAVSIGRIERRILEPERREQAGARVETGLVLFTTGFELAIGLRDVDHEGVLQLAHPFDVGKFVQSDIRSEGRA